MFIWLNKLLGRVEERRVLAHPTKRRRGPKWRTELVSTEVGQSGKAGKWILMVVVGLSLFLSVFAPLAIGMGLLSYLAVIFFKLPGLKQAFKVLLGIYCKINGDMEAIYGIAKKPFNALSWVAKKGNQAVKGVIGAAAKGLKSIPVIGDTGAVNTLSDIISVSGTVFASPFAAVEKASDLASLGLDYARKLSRFVCQLNNLAKDLEARGYKDAFGKAINCSNWDASRYGPLDSPENMTKGGIPKYCVEGDLAGDKSNFVIPRWLIGIYQAAGDQYNVPWEVLAAINLNDTNLGLSKWQTASRETGNRVGWIPFTEGEWFGRRGSSLFAINDNGGTAPNYYGDPYKNKAGYITVKDSKGKWIRRPVPQRTCPIPLDTKGSPWQYTQGTAPADNEATGDDAGLGDYSGGKLSPKQIAQLMLQVGFPAEEVVPGVAIALAESGGDPKITAPNGAAGMWQFLGHPDLKDVQNDPAGSTKATLNNFYKPDVKSGRNGWRQWATFIGPSSQGYDGRMLDFLDEAKRGARAAGVDDAAVNAPRDTWGTHKNFGEGGGVGLDASDTQNRRLALESLKPVLKQYLNDQRGEFGYQIRTRGGGVAAEYQFMPGGTTAKQTAQGYTIVVRADRSTSDQRVDGVLRYLVRQFNTALNPGGQDSGGSGSVSGRTYQGNVNAGGGYRLLPSQATMADIIARRTGIDVNVIRAQIINEMGDSRSAAAQGREREKNYNWLNIGWFDAGRGSITYDDTWSDPTRAGNATADFIQGTSKFRPSSGIVDAYRRAKGASAAEAFRLIGNSGWATSKYALPGGAPGSMLAAIYAKLKKIDQPDGAMAEDGSSAVAVSLDPDAQYDPCDPVDGIFGLAQILSQSGARGAVWQEAYPDQKELQRLINGTVKKESSDADDGDAVGDGELDDYMQAADKLDKMRLPYVWGGGHDELRIKDPKPGLDCSGTVSYVLQQAGLEWDTTVSGSFGGLSRLGWKKGTGGGDAITVFYDPGHVLMKIGNKYFGTSGSNPGGGAGFIDTPSASYLSRFETIHIVPSGGTSNNAGLGDDDSVSFDRSAAKEAVSGLSTRVAGFSVAGSDGKILFSSQGTKASNSASVVKLMFLAALSRKYADREIPSEIAEAAQGMMRESNNGDANTVLKDVGRAEVQQVARAAGMKSFRLSIKPSCSLSGGNLRRGSGCFAAGSSQVTSDDQARFAALATKVFQGQNASLLLELASDGDVDGKVGVGGRVRDADFGIYKSKASGALALRKSGWRPEGSDRDWTITQTAQVRAGGRMWGVSFVTRGGEFEKTAEQIREVMDKSFTFPDGNNDAAQAGSAAQRFNSDCFSRSRKKFPDLDDMLRNNDGSSLRLDTCLSPIDPPSAALCDPSNPNDGSQNTINSVELQSEKAAQTFGLTNARVLQAVVIVQSDNGCDMPDNERAAGWAGFSDTQWERVAVNGSPQRRNFALRSSSVDSLFALARYLSKAGAKGKPSNSPEALKAAYKEALEQFFRGNSKDSDVEAKVERVLGAAAPDGDANAIVQSPIGKAIQLRNYRIDPDMVLAEQQPCKTETVYAVCIAKIYELLVKEYNRAAPADEGAGMLGGGCGKVEGGRISIGDLPNIKDKPETSTGARDVVQNKVREDINITGAPSWGRKDAVKATVAVTKAFQECYPEFKKKWKDIQINDWGAALVSGKYGVSGHASHQNGADNDYTILNVTSFDLPGQKYDREKAIVLAALFLRAGAQTIYFDDPEVQEFFVKNRKLEAEKNPEYKSKYPAWNDTPVTWAYSGGAAANKNHHNHFHVRWYTGAGNAFPPKVTTYLGAGAGQLDLELPNSGSAGSECSGRARAPRPDSGGDSCTYGPYGG